MRMFGLVLFAALALAASSQEGAGAAEDAPLDLKSYSCGEHLEIVNAEDGRAELVSIWAHGYFSALRGVDENSPPITTAMVEEFVVRLEKACADAPEKLFISAVKDLK